MEVTLDLISDSLGEDSFYKMNLVQSEGTLIITLSNFGENRIIEVNANQLRKALDAIKEDD